jgi:hypothetical protein
VASPRRTCAQAAGEAAGAAVTGRPFVHERCASSPVVAKIASAFKVCRGPIAGTDSEAIPRMACKIPRTTIPPDHWTGSSHRERASAHVRRRPGKNKTSPPTLKRTAGRREVQPTRSAQGR